MHRVRHLHRKGLDAFTSAPIKIEADQQSGFKVLMTAEGWSGWFTPEVTGDFTEGSEIVCELWSSGSRHSAAFASTQRVERRLVVVRSRSSYASAKR